MSNRPIAGGGGGFPGAGTRRPLAQSAPAANFIPPNPPSTGPRKPNFDPPPFDLPPSYQKTSIFDDPAAVAALTGSAAGAGAASTAPGDSSKHTTPTGDATSAASSITAGANGVAAGAAHSGARPIIMGPREQTGRIVAPSTAQVQQQPNKSLARSLTNNTPSFIMAASCPNPEFLSQVAHNTRAGLNATEALAAAAANADVVRKAQDMSMGRSPTIFSIMSGVEQQLANMSLGGTNNSNSNAVVGAGQAQGGAQPGGQQQGQLSSRARSSFSGGLNGGPGGRVSMGPPGVAEEGEDEDEDGDDELAPAPLDGGIEEEEDDDIEEDEEQLQFNM